MAHAHCCVLIFALVLLGVAHSHPFYNPPATESEADIAKPEVVKCTDKVSECPDGYTCCSRAGHSGFGCCQGLNFICCDDHLHCCPAGYECDVKNSNCKKNTTQIAYSKKTIRSPPPAKFTPKVIICADGKTKCPDQSTCCMLPTNSYGCCPSPEATCCKDKIHCCPHGHDCEASGCKKGDITTPMLTKFPATPHVIEVTVLCPDGSTECPKNETCCEISADTWGCCPAANAVCCYNESFCCPENATCNVENKTCITKVEVPLTKIQLQSRMKIVGNSVLNSLVGIGSNVCPDDESECKDSQTCCPIGVNEYGCCPGVDAKCCSDMKHCCKSGFICEKNGQCTQKKTVMKDIL